MNERPTAPASRKKAVGRQRNLGLVQFVLNLIKSALSLPDAKTIKGIV